MKRLFLILSAAAFFIVSGCTTTKEQALTDNSQRDVRERLDEAVVKQAVESKRFVVRLDRLYIRNGGFFDLRPRSNYIIVDGNKAVINAAYMGSQHDVRPIAGINMHGQTVDYEITRKMDRGIYEIRMKVGNNSAAFDVYLTIGKNGTTNASVNSIRIENVRYRGHVVPLGDRAFVPADRELI